MDTFIYPLTSGDCMGNSTSSTVQSYIVISIQNLVVVPCAKFTTMSLLECCVAVTTGTVACDAGTKKHSSKWKIYISLHGNAINEFWLTILQFWLSQCIFLPCSSRFSSSPIHYTGMCVCVCALCTVSHFSHHNSMQKVIFVLYWMITM